MESLNPQQRAVVNSNHRRIIFFGSRQIGKTTTLAHDAIDHALDGEFVALSAPTHPQSLELVDRVDDILTENRLIDNGDIGRPTRHRRTLEGGGLLEATTIHELPRRIRELDADYTRDTYDHIVIDSVEHVDPETVDNVSEHRLSHTITVAGTAVTNSPNIERLVRSDSWFSVYATLTDSPHIDGDTPEALREYMCPAQELTEVDGYLVTDPRSLADVSTEPEPPSFTQDGSISRHS